VNEIQENYLRAKIDFDEAIFAVECYVNCAIKDAGLNLNTVPMELLLSLKAEGSKKFNIYTLRKVLRDKEAHLLEWGCEYVSGLNVDAQKAKTVEGSKLATIRQGMLENFSKMEG